MKGTKIFNRNNLFQKFEVLKTNRNKRYKYNEFLVEGVRSLNEAVNNNWKIKSFIYDRNNLSGWANDMINKVNTDANFYLTPELLIMLCFPKIPLLFCLTDHQTKGILVL